MALAYGLSLGTEIGDPWITLNSVMTADEHYLCSSWYSCWVVCS